MINRGGQRGADSDSRAPDTGPRRGGIWGVKQAGRAIPYSPPYRVNIANRDFYKNTVRSYPRWDVARI